MTEWTPEMVEERLVEAAAVLKRLPPVRVRRLLQHLADDEGRVLRPGRPDAGADASATPVGRCHQQDGGDARLDGVAGAGRFEDRLDAGERRPVEGDLLGRRAGPGCGA